MSEGGNLSPNAPCRAEAESHLSSLPVTAADIKADIKEVQMFTRNVGATRLVGGKGGHDARVRLNSCSGWLILQLSPGCHLQQAYTLGDCAIEGISHY